MKNTIIRTTTIGFMLFIGFILFSANTGSNLFFFKLMKDIPMSDKLGHLGLIAMLTFLINLSLKNKNFNWFKINILVGSLFVFCFITIEEFSQIWLERRTFDLLDLASNYLGIAIASWLNIKIMPIKTRTNFIYK